MDCYLTPKETLALQCIADELGPGGRYRWGKDVSWLYKLGVDADAGGFLLSEHNATIIANSRAAKPKTHELDILKNHNYRNTRWIGEILGSVLMKMCVFESVWKTHFIYWNYSYSTPSLWIIGMLMFMGLGSNTIWSAGASKK
jgi:hypothetical protein